MIDVSRGKNTGLSPAAFALARLFIERSEHGLTTDPSFGPEQLQEIAGLTDEDIRDGVHELEERGFVRVLRSLDGSPAARAVGFTVLASLGELFAELDEFVKPWKPADLINNAIQGNIAQIAERYGWPPRRMNPAITYLESRRLVQSSQTLGAHPYRTLWLQASDATRRFVKSRSMRI